MGVIFLYLGLYKKLGCTHTKIRTNFGLAVRILKFIQILAVHILKFSAGGHHGVARFINTETS